MISNKNIKKSGKTEAISMEKLVTIKLLKPKADNEKSLFKALQKRETIRDLNHEKKRRGDGQAATLLHNPS